MGDVSIVFTAHDLEMPLTEILEIKNAYKKIHRFRIHIHIRVGVQGRAVEICAVEGINAERGRMNKL